MNHTNNSYNVPTWAMWLGGVILVYLMAKSVFEHIMLFVTIMSAE